VLCFTWHSPTSTTSSCPVVYYNSSTKIILG
jgi:hypothetical protein